MTDPKDTGKALVRERLIARCDEAGLTRPRKMTQEVFAKFRGRLVDALDHMGPEALDTLADLVIDNAKRGEWPSETVIRQWGHALTPRPAGDRRIVTSWLASVEGPIAQDGGYLTELYRFLMATRRPPSTFETRNMRADAADNRRQLAYLTSRRAEGRATQSEFEWAEAYARDTAAAEAIVAKGAEARAAKAGANDHAA